MIENVSTQLTVFHCFAHCLLPGRAFASLYVLLFLEKEAEIGGRDDLDAKYLWSSLKVWLNVKLRVLGDNFVLFDALRPSQQFFSYVGMGLPGLNQY